MKWANSGFFSIGALEHFIEFLYPLQSRGTSTSEKTSSDSKDTESDKPSADHTKAEVDTVIKNVTQKLDALRNDRSSDEYKEQYLILSALNQYKNTARNY